MTKSSAGRRQRRLERRGRPPGSYRPLLKDPQRFSIAAWLTLEPFYGPHVTARAVAVWIEERTPITIATIEGLVNVISADCPPPRDRDRDLDDAGSLLAKKAELVRSRATERELAWLSQCSGALRGLLKFHLEGNVAGINQALDVLRACGWSETLDRIIGRLTPALLANPPPFEGHLSAKAQALLAVLRARAEKKEACNSLSWRRFSAD